jgi:hypothetical protein
MVQIELSTTELETLTEVCEEALSDLRMEIAGTDAMDFRERLKQKEVLLRSVLGRLAVAAVV